MVRYIKSLKEIIGIILCLFFAQPVSAGDGAKQKTMVGNSLNLETLTVTVDKREVKSQQVSTSLTVHSDTDLADSGIFTSEELFNILPNIHLAKSGPAADLASLVSIRGVTQTMSLSPSFGFYIDDVYYSEYDSNLLDVERIELLRGPQGTLYGRNTAAGVLNIITKKPDNELGGRIEVGYASFNTSSLKFSLSGPVQEDRLFFRIAGNYDKSDGFMENKYLDNDRANEPENSETKLTVNYIQSDQLSFSLGIDTLKYKSGYTDYVPLSKLKDEPYQANVDYEGKSLKDAWGANLRAISDTGSIKVISITAMRRDENKLDHDMDFTSADVFRQSYQRDYNTLSQEFRLLSGDEDSSLEWILGLYAFEEDQDHEYIFSTGADSGMGVVSYPTSGESKISGRALFGEASYTFLDMLKVTSGVRFDQENQVFNYDATAAGGGEGSSSETFNATLPKLVFSYVGEEQYLLFAGATRGYKAGGFNLITNVGEKFDPEFTWNYEVGAKSNWMNNRLIVNATVYHIDWKDMQVNASNGTDFYTENGGKATSRGYELEIVAKPIQGLKLSGSWAYTHSKFDNYQVKGSTQNFSSHYVPYVPDYTGHLSIFFGWSNGFYTTADIMHTGRVYLNNENTLKESDYNIVNVKVGFEQDSFEVFLWSKNLLNETYATTYADMSNYGFDVVARPGNPQTIGISLVAKM